MPFLTHPKNEVIKKICRTFSRKIDGEFQFWSFYEQLGSKNHHQVKTTVLIWFGFFGLFSQTKFSNLRDNRSLNQGLSKSPALAFALNTSACLVVFHKKQVKKIWYSHNRERAVNCLITQVLIVSDLDKIQKQKITKLEQS